MKTTLETSKNGDFYYLSECAHAFIQNQGDKLNSTQFIQYIYNHEFVQNTLMYFDYQFEKKDLLVTALGHTSFANEFFKLKISSYEKLEFLGDSILGAFVSSQIIGKFPNASEGQLSKLRGALVNEEVLCELASVANLEKCILVGKGELNVKGMLRSAIMADVLEATLAAIFLDSSFDRAKKAFNQLIHCYEEEKGIKFFDLERLNDFDSKTQLQEIIMSIYKTTPVYKAVELEDKGFRVQLFINDQKIDELDEVSKKKGQKKLARKILKDKSYIIKGDKTC